MSVSRNAWVLLTLLTAAPLLADEAPKKLIAVLEFHSKLAETDKADADPGYFSDVVRGQALDELPRARLMTRENMLVLLAAQGKELADCEGECEVDTGRKLGADFVVSGDLLKVGTSFKLDLKLHATSSGELLAGAQASGKSVDELDAAVPGCVRKLAAPLVGMLGPVPLTDGPAIRPGVIAPAKPAKPGMVVESLPPPSAGNSPPPSQVHVKPFTPPGVDAGTPGGGLVPWYKNNNAPIQQDSTVTPARPAAAQPFQYIAVKGNKIVAKTHYFELGKTTVRAGAEPMMKEIAAVLRGPPPRASSAVCMAELKTAGALRRARQRALAMRHALIELRVPQEAVQAVWLRPGESFPGYQLGPVCTVVLR